jgi:hypothetical protein
VGFVVEKAALGQVFFEYFGFPCCSFHPLLHAHYHSSTGSGTVGQIVTDVPSGFSLYGFSKLIGTVNNTFFFATIDKVFYYVARHEHVVSTEVT